jgi:hypothetical protein
MSKIIIVITLLILLFGCSNDKEKEIEKTVELFEMTITSNNEINSTKNMKLNKVNWEIANPACAFLSSGKYFMDDGKTMFYRVSLFLSEIYYSLAIDLVTKSEDSPAKIVGQYFIPHYRLAKELDVFGEFSDMYFIKWIDTNKFVIGIKGKEYIMHIQYSKDIDSELIIQYEKFIVQD